MRVIWFSHRDPSDLRAGGAEEFIREVARRLTGRGHNVVFVTRDPGSSTSNESIPGVRSVRMPDNLTLHAFVPVALRQFDPEFVIDDLAHVLPWASPWFTRVPGVAFFRHLHRRTLSGQVDPAGRFILTAIESQYSSLYRTWPFVTESQSSAMDLKDLGIPAERIRCIRPGCDLAVFRPVQRETEPRLVYFSGLRPYKRPELAVHLLARIRSAGIPATLSVLGEGPSLQTVRATARDLQVEDSVSWLGRLPRNRVAEIVGKSWLNVQCSRAEGWGLTCTEAAACGTPSVGFSVPGTGESIIDGSTGRLVPDGDMNALVSAAIEILSNPEDWQLRTERAGRSRDWDLVAAEWDNMIRDLARADA